MLFLDVTKKYSYDSQYKNKRSLTTANRMLRNLQDIRLCYDIRGKSYDKYDPFYAVPHRS